VTVSLVFFYIYGAIAIAGAIGLVIARRLVHAVMSMFATLFAVAALYLLLGSEFLAAMQLFVYGGAITVLVLFVLMLTRPVDEVIGQRGGAIRLAAGTLTLVFFAVVAATLGRAEWKVVAATSTDTTELASILFSRYVLPFEIAGLVLTIALIGAIVLAREDDAELPSAEEAEA
jgi:NADH-quinone oxidoreductase subunit J